MLARRPLSYHYTTLGLADDEKFNVRFSATYQSRSVHNQFNSPRAVQGLLNAPQNGYDDAEERRPSKTLHNAGAPI